MYLFEESAFSFVDPFYYFSGLFYLFLLGSVGIRNQKEKTSSLRPMLQVDKVLLQMEKVLLGYAGWAQESWEQVGRAWLKWLLPVSFEPVLHGLSKRENFSHGCFIIQQVLVKKLLLESHLVLPATLANGKYRVLISKRWLHTWGRSRSQTFFPTPRQHWTLCEHWSHGLGAASWDLWP